MKGRNQRGSLVWLLSRLRPHVWYMCAALLCICMAGCAAALDPLLMRTLIDYALPTKQLHSALWLASGIATCFLSRSVLQSVGGLVTLTISQRSVRDLRISVLEKFHELCLSYHEQTPIGDKLAILEHDVDEIATFGADTVNEGIRALLLCCVNVAMMAALNVMLAVMLAPLLPLFVLVQRYYRRLLQLHADETRARMGCATALVTEHLGAVPQLQFLGAHQLVLSRAIHAWDAMLRAQLTQRKVQTWFGISVSAIFIAAILLVLGGGSISVISHRLTVGGLVAFYAYIARTFDPIGSSMNIYARFQVVGASIERVRHFLSLQSTIQDKGQQIATTERIAKGFDLRDISCTLSNSIVLSGITATIHAQERLGIVGQTGSGKSTLARLLVRAIEPSGGSICFDGRPLKDYTLGSLRAAICYVPQQPVLFNGTIKDNLTYVRAAATDGELYNALEVAHFTRALGKLPNGLDTYIGPGGALLSGGERQRLAIARAVLTDCAVLILDEATSSLDLPTERAVLDSIERAYPHRMLIMISHRLSSLVWADRLIIVANGRVQATGDHAGLYENSTFYRMLFDGSVMSSEESTDGTVVSPEESTAKAG
jgi:ABC-type multidrug transport system fused ATPase/permease subunit